MQACVHSEGLRGAFMLETIAVVIIVMESNSALHLGKIITTTGNLQNINT